MLVLAESCQLHQHSAVGNDFISSSSLLDIDYECIMQEGNMIHSLMCCSLKDTKVLCSKSMSMCQLQVT